MTLNLKAGSHKSVIYVTQINNLHGNVDGGHANKHTPRIGFSFHFMATAKYINHGQIIIMIITKLGGWL